jgi:hypothetical protein
VIDERFLADERFRDFAATIHGRVPDGYTAVLFDDREVRRGICGDHGRVALSPQGLCSHCAGIVHDVDEVEAMREAAKRFGLTSQPCDAVKFAAAQFMDEVIARCWAH